MRSIIAIILTLPLTPLLSCASFAGPFDDFTPLPCADFTADGMDTWLHGFLSGVNWMNPSAVVEALPGVDTIRERVGEICEASTSEEITPSDLNRLYDSAR